MMKKKLFMKVIILAGGRGTRLSEETHSRPKPMVEVGGHPILWHIMKYYASYGHKEFVICVGYLGYQIKEYFYHYALHNSNSVTYDLGLGSCEMDRRLSEDWKITVLDTGLDTTTGGRISKALKFIGDEDFFISYGDVLANVQLDKLLELHKDSGLLATVSAGYPPAKYGSLAYRELPNKPDYMIATGFSEKPQKQFGLVSCGFFVCKKGILQYLDKSDGAWEDGPLQHLSGAGELGIYRHEGFWQPMDTMRDRNELNELWGYDGSSAPWKSW